MLNFLVDIKSYIKIVSSVRKLLTKWVKKKIVFRNYDKNFSPRCVDEYKYQLLLDFPFYTGVSPSFTFLWSVSWFVKT